MDRMIRFFAVVLFFVFCLGVSSVAEEITLTTYYPAPNGAYVDLSATNSLVIGVNYAGTETAPANGMIIEGNVGIGVVVPTEALDVNGTINATGFSANGAAGYTGDLEDSTGSVIATVVNGIITSAVDFP